MVATAAHMREQLHHLNRSTASRHIVLFSTRSHAKRHANPFRDPNAAALPHTPLTGILAGLPRVSSHRLCAWAAVDSEFIYWGLHPLLSEAIVVHLGDDADGARGDIIPFGGGATFDDDDDDADHDEGDAADENDDGDR